MAELGPRIGFLQECLRRWDHWLKGQDNGAMQQARLCVWLHEYDPPAPRQPVRSGRWISLAQWPREPAAVELFPVTGGGLAAYEGGTRVHSAQSSLEIPRDGV